MPTLASPQAFELCEGGTCGDPKVETDNKHVSCQPNDNCRGNGCYCQLFHRRKGSADTEPWHTAGIDQSGMWKYKPDKQDYRCFCVKPILQTEITLDGVTYTTQYILCGSGACALEVVTDLGGSPKYKVKCSGKCDGDCKCTLFRLPISGGGGGAGGWDPKDAKWERVAKADTQVGLEDRYLYRCFCLK